MLACETTTPKEGTAAGAPNGGAALSGTTPEPQSPPTAAGPDSRSTSATPAQPAAGALPVPDWRQRQAEPPVVEPGDDGIRVDVDSVMLTGLCPGEGRKPSDGIRLVVSGTVTQAAGPLYHRAEVTAGLFVRFGPDVAFLRASEGLGFDPPVSSEVPWRPGTTRRFLAKTRPIDGIYCEFDAVEARSAVHVHAEGPMGETVDRWAWGAPLAWSAVRGLRVEARATVSSRDGGSPRFDGPYASGRAAPGTAFKVLGVSRDKALVAADGAFAWLPLDSLDFRDLWSSSGTAAAPTPKVEWGDGEFRYSMSRFRVVPNVFAAATERPSRLLIASVKATNHGARPSRCTAGSIRMMLSTGDDISPVDSASLDAACRSGVAAGESAVGDVSFALAALSEPWAVGHRGGSAVALAVGE